MSKAKQQGTGHETWIVNELHAHKYSAQRIAEGGSADEGDVEAVIMGHKWVLEAKARSSLNVQSALGRARSKAKAANGGTDIPVAVVWKRLVRVAGKQLRQPVAGERVVVILGWDDYVNLINRATWGSNEQLS